MNPPYRLTMIVEWTVGTRERFHWVRGELVPRPPWEWDLPPVNYGCVPGYLNPADDAELDAVWADPEPIPPGTRLEGHVLGMIRVEDGDHKIILGEPGDLGKLDREGLERWFVGREARFVSVEEALEVVEASRKVFLERHRR